MRHRIAARTILRNKIPDTPSDSIKARVESSSAPGTRAHDTQYRPKRRPVSLLWPPESSRLSGRHEFRLSGQASRDLGVTSLLGELEPDARVRKDVDATMTNIVTDISTLEYRLDILDDFVKNAGLVDAFEKLVPVLIQVFQRRAPSDDANRGLFTVAWRLGELENYLQALHIIDEALGGTDLHSRALRELRDDTRNQLKSDSFAKLEKELPQLLRRIRGARSLTLGINLSPDLLPTSATIVSVNDTQFVDTPLLRTLFGKSASGGIAKLHVLEKASGGVFRPIMTPLFRDLSEVMSIVSRETSIALESFSKITTLHIDTLRGEVLFYLAAVRCVRAMRSMGLPMCRPTFRPSEDRFFEAGAAYNINLAYENERRSGKKRMSESVVPSDVLFDAGGRILILTGPNSGGKTVYARAVGIMQVMAQTGMYVPAANAVISPVDGVFTHFSIEEQITNQTGRLGDEAKRLSDIIEHVTDKSLVILNESL